MKKNKAAADSVAHALAALPRAPRYLVAFSGGLDSTVLLHAMIEPARRQRVRLQAVHVNHNLYPESESWAQHCEAFCRGHRITFTGLSVLIDRSAGASLEASARDARYQALQNMMQKGDVLLSAHHQDDQLETFLLMALRGSGPAGLAAMPRDTAFGAGRLLRPLLDVSRASLEAYAVQHELQWLTDPSNADTRFDRNYLRHEIVPRLRARWPAAGDTIGRAARHCAGTIDSLNGLAARDWVACRREDGASLSVARLAALAPARAALCLRYWLSRQRLPVPDEKRLIQIQATLLTAGRDRAPKVAWTGAEVRRYRDGLYVMAPLPPAPEESLAWETRSPLELPGALGVLHAPPGLADARLSVVFRAGGEELKPAGQAHHRPVKKLLQEAGIVPWMRDRLPLVHRGGELIAVGDLWHSEALPAALRWEHRPPLF